jgi:hypothetical protein
MYASIRSTRPIVLSAIAVGAALAVTTAFAMSGCEQPSEEDPMYTPSSVRPTKNLCVGQAANTFHCIDDTNFELCTGNGQFTVNACPKGFCATRHPPEKNPCIGAARARQIDGVPPTPPNQIDDNGGGAANQGGGGGGVINNGNACQKNLCIGQAANTFHCIDGTTFQQCTGGANFVLGSCPPGFCATRNPADKNPCIGAARAAQIDGVAPTPACE